MRKKFEKGQPYRPAAKVAKVKNGTPTVLLIRGKRYVLDHKDRGKAK
ncbi:hypothetical protein JCM10914A_56120 [Paenibacillus sp. JCM 10914]|nr:hypothetical protein [Paenibacillus sp. JCM 10914]